MSDRLTAAQAIELTVRAANLIKTVSGLIGAHDPLLASLVINEAIGELKPLAEFIMKCKP